MSTNNNHLEWSPASAPPVPVPFSTVLDHTFSQSSLTDVQVSALVDQGFTRGLAESLMANLNNLPLRIWVIDNSGSMQQADGHRLVPTKTKGDIKLVACTRWEEIKECLSYHIQMAGLLCAPSSFRLLNNPGSTVGPSHFEVAKTGGHSNIAHDVSTALGIMSRTKPGGVTPLSSHIREIYENVQLMSPQLSSQGRRVAIIIATDGLPTDENGLVNDYVRQEFMQSLRLLEGLPIWLVIRLCTDDEEIVDFYNNLDDQLELSIDVLDDYISEAKEIHQHNKWLNYALPLHRLREMGYHDRLFDLLDERTLTAGELREFCGHLFGIGNLDGVPDPLIDWKGFLSVIRTLLRKESLQWNPIKKKMAPWLDLTSLNEKYGDVAGCVVM